MRLDGLLLVGSLAAAAPGSVDEHMANRCFPAQATAVLDAFRADWYCKHLTAAGEESLRADPGYRFTYLPSFHSPRVVTVEWKRGEPVIVGKILSGRGGYEPGTILRRTRRILTPAEVRILEERLKDAGLWDLQIPRVLGHDGSSWILEGRKAGWYQIQDVWSPREGQSAKYRQACIYLLTLADIMPLDDERLY